MNDFPIGSRCLCRNQQTSALTVFEVHGTKRRLREDATGRLLYIEVADLMPLDLLGEHLTGKR